MAKYGFMDESGNYFCNNLVERRPDDPSTALIRCAPSGEVRVTINGYAIIPLEKYYKLIGREFNGSASAEADKVVRERKQSHG